MNAVKLPIVLTNDLKRGKPIQADALSITVSARDKSTASLTLPITASPYPMHTFFELFTSKGSVGVFWATTPSLDDVTGRTYALTHAIDTLRKNVYKEQITFEGTRQGFLSKLFSYQDPVFWQIGDIYAPENAYKSENINYTNLSDLFTRFLQDNVDLYPVYDFSTTPWTVNIRKLPDEIGARFSLTRNAETCRIVYDDKQQATRLYLAVNTPEKVNGITKYTAELKTYEDADAIAQYGVFEKTASIKTDEITGTPDDWAREFFKKYKDPTVQITVDGYELWKQTGEIYDEMAVGKRAKVALPEFGATTTQRIESVTYPDALKAPTAITVSLATKQKTFTTAISNLEKEVDKVGGIAGGAALSAANAEEVTAWSLIMQKVEEAVDFTGIITLYETGIIIDAESGAKIYSLEQGFQSTFSELKVTSEAIEANSKAINLNAEKITAKADKIELKGLVKVSELDAAKADIFFQNSQAIETLLLEAERGVFNGLKASSFNFGETAMSKKQIEMGNVKSGPVVSESTASLNLNHSHSVTVADDGKVTLGAAVTTEEAGNFKIADTKAYKDGVSAAKASVTLSSAGWISGVNTVSASNGKTFPVSLPAFSASADAFNAQHKAIVKFFTASVPNPLESIEVDASSVYYDGYAAGWAEAAKVFNMEWTSQSSIYKNLLTITHPGYQHGDADINETIKVLVTCDQSAITSVPGDQLYASSMAKAYTSTNGAASIQRAIATDYTQRTGSLN